MASVYKTVSKRQKRAQEAEEMGIDMASDIDSDTSDSDSDLDEDEDEDNDNENDHSKASASSSLSVTTDGTKSSSPKPSTITANGATAATTTTPSNPPQPQLRYKSRVLMLTSRGVSYRQRHLLSDLHSLLPHTVLETKLDTSKKASALNPALNSLASLHSTPTIFFLEARKRAQDLYLWLARSPNGPTCKFHVGNLHTQAELGFQGNVLKGGRGIVVFDGSFDSFGGGSSGGGGLSSGWWRGVVRELLRSVFCVPRRARGVKPFIDRVIGVYYVDEKIWVRVYEIRESEGKGGGWNPQNAAAVDVDDSTTTTTATTTAATGIKNSKGGKKEKHDHDVSLVEVGPRFVLTPILILEGSFGGPVIYENREFVSPNQVRREIRTRKAGRYRDRVEGKREREGKRKAVGLEVGGGKVDELDSGKLFR